MKRYVESARFSLVQLLRWVKCCLNYEVIRLIDHSARGLQSGWVDEHVCYMGWNIDLRYPSPLGTWGGDNTKRKRARSFSIPARTSRSIKDYCHNAPNRRPHPKVVGLPSRPSSAWIAASLLCGPGLRRSRTPPGGLQDCLCESA